ncbi:3',5'-cyclic AMP phosphodiesterase CpdA [Micromonospora rhizosphaerae]|uniref:3',5'-cyclic AMP phosphodiesterase CpdA n=1 Tax=Micromonospora rhizosphaerae TaxID=568872 RepID=A0A1C6SYB5_9ACTN|nr:metallophosphoesterase [Micromonospora rhizosphaerae]SCL34488.1 3',5'-cyclic AMP phosphodiesterase CpdA [Micromonospora rhizosphaerae]
MLASVMIIAHISDTHLDNGERALARTRRVMRYLRSCTVDAILVSGDLADHGEIHEYEQVKAELTADVPVLMLPGNHDGRSAYRKVLLDGGGDAPINQLHRVGGALFALCDSSIPGRDDGLLAAETLAWLRGVVATADAPVFVGLHHHPIALHNPLVDGIRLVNADELAAIIVDSPQVVAVLCGHAHAAAAGTFAGRPLLAAPGVVSATRLPWTTDEELTWTNTADLDDPPGVAFHVLDDNGTLTTHFRVAPA